MTDTSKHVMLNNEYILAHGLNVSLDVALLNSIQREATGCEELGYTYENLLWTDHIYELYLFRFLPSMKRELDSILQGNPLKIIKFTYLSDSGWAVVTIWQR